jgi:tetratricopeptide (TPR) repeat protein
MRMENSTSRVPGRRGGHEFWKRAFGVVVAGLLLFLAVKDFLGDGYFREYRKARTEVRSIESGFSGLEVLLKSAWRYSKNPEYAKELGRLYADMARVENQAGREEGREKFCDAAVEAYGRAIRGNPIDAFSHFEAGMVYLLSNYPLMTYADRAKVYFRKALELKPADEFLHLHVLIVYLTLWDVLEPGEEAFVRGAYRKMVGADPAFPGKLAEQWKKSFGTADRLDELLPLIQ